MASDNIRETPIDLDDPGDLGILNNASMAVDPTTGFQPLEQPSLVDAIQDQLRDRILNGDLPRGYPIRESQVARQMGVSRAPVREALRRLEQSELVVKPSNRSYEVNSFTPEDVRELAMVRMALETLAARAAMRDPQSLEGRLRERMSLMSAAVTSQDLEMAFVADRLFHEEIVRLGGNKRLSKVYATLRDQIQMALHTIEAARARGFTVERAVVWHEALLEPIADRDTEGFVDALQFHILVSAGIVPMNEAPARQLQILADGGIVFTEELFSGD